MSQHFRTAILTVILAGGTICSYVAAYAVMGETPAQASGAAIERALPLGQTDLSLAKACAPVGSTAMRRACVQPLAPVRPVRIIDLATLEAGSTIR